MRPDQADELIRLSEEAIHKEYCRYWDEVQNEHGHSNEKMGILIGLRYGLNKVFEEEN